MVEERAGRNLHFNLLAKAADRYAVQSLDRALRLAMGRAESGEVMLAGEGLCSVVHRFRIEARCNLPAQAAVKGQRRPAVGDLVKIAASLAGKAGVPFVIDDVTGKHRNRVGAKACIDPLAQPEWGQLGFQIKMGAHRQRMDASVGSACCKNTHVLTGDLVDRLFHRLLHAGAVVLMLPAHERAAIIFQGEGKAGHCNRVPFGIFVPLRKDLRSIAGFPAF